MNFSTINFWTKALPLCLLCMITLSSHAKTPLKATTATVPDDTITVVSDTTEYAGSSKSLNDIRFANYTDNDWLDNEYIRCLRGYVDDYISGKVKNEELDPYKKMLKGKFVVGWAGPFLMGGLFLQIIFVDYPNDMFSAWVYSEVDEETETVLDYEVRSISKDEDPSGFTKEDIIELMKEHPELKLW